MIANGLSNRLGQINLHSPLHQRGNASEAAADLLAKFAGNEGVYSGVNGQPELIRGAVALQYRFD